MNQPVKVFKPDKSGLWVFRGMIIFGLGVALAGLIAHQAMISCLGIFVLTIFSALSFNQPSQTIAVYADRVVFFYPGQEPWTIGFTSFAKLELTTNYRNVTQYSPGRSILLRFVESDGKVCAEANVNVFDKTVISSMIELLRVNKPDLLLNEQANELLRISGSKGNTIRVVTKPE